MNAKLEDLPLVSYPLKTKMGSRDGAVVRALPPMSPGFNFRTRCHMWVAFVIGSRLCSERFFFGYSGFSLLENQHLQIPIQSRNARHFLTSSCELLGAPCVNNLHIYIYFTYICFAYLHNM